MAIFIKLTEMKSSPRIDTADRLVKVYVNVAHIKKMYSNPEGTVLFLTGADGTERMIVRETAEQIAGMLATGEFHPQ